MFELYSKFVGKNEGKIVDDFCNKIKKELIGDLTLDEYSRFAFWKEHVGSELNHFYSKFKEDTKTTIPYNLFCELMWNTLDGKDIPEELQEIMSSIKSLQVGEA